MITAPLKQQTAAISKAALRQFFAYTAEMGTGKSWCVLYEAEQLFLAGKIKMLVLVALNGVHLNWTRREIPKHWDLQINSLIWSANKTKTFMAQVEAFEHYEGPLLRVFTVNVEAFSVAGSFVAKLLTRMMLRMDAMMALDESDTIKIPNSARTKNLIRVGKYARYKRIVTGTIITESPFDAYAQFKFLSPELLGFNEFSVFKAYFAEWEKRSRLDGHDYPVMKSYRNLEILKSKIDQHSFTILKKDCLDLPPKVYEVRPVMLSPNTREIYEQAKKALILRLLEGKMTMAHAFTRLIRLQQILGGFIQLDNAETVEPLPGPNAKLESLLHLISNLPLTRKVIIWARFVHECRAIHQLLDNHGAAVGHWGEIAEEQRSAHIDRFQMDPTCRFFVGTQSSGGRGTTLTAATQVAYFSNEFSLSKRAQSEDRAHRIGQTESVTYTDLTAVDTIDEKLLGVLAAKQELSQLFAGEDTAALAAWLQSQSTPL